MVTVMRQGTAIPRLGKPTFELINELELKSQPAILDGTSLNWPALNWTMEYLKKQYGDIICPAFLNMPKNQVLVNFYSKDYAAEISLKNFVEKLESRDEACYIRQMPIKRAPELSGEFNFTDLTPKASYKQFTNVWLASAKTRSTLHWDTPNNLTVQLLGKKNTFLFSPEQAQYLYPFEDQLRLSKLDPLNWDSEKYPEFAHAQPLKGTINAGEILFLPKCWWHFMYQDENSFSLSNWYGDEVATKYFYLFAKNLGWRHLTRPAIDFIILGILGKKFNPRLSADIPTGRYLYNLCIDKLSRWQKG